MGEVQNGRPRLQQAGYVEPLLDGCRSAFFKEGLKGTLNETGQPVGEFEPADNGECIVPCRRVAKELGDFGRLGAYVAFGERRKFLSNEITDKWMEIEG